MCDFRFTISTASRKEVECHVQTAQHLGHLRRAKYCLALLAISAGQSLAQVALVLRGHEKTVATGRRDFCCYGLQGAPHRKPTGRPPQLPPTQKAALAPGMEEGPVQAGGSGACWRSPMSQRRIDARFGVYDNVFYIAQLLQN